MENNKEPRIRVFTQEELDAIVGVAEKDQEQALVAFVLNCGAKTSEIVNMRLEDVGDSQVFLHGKTGLRAVPVSPEVSTMLRAQAQGNVIWADSQGRPISTSALQYRVRRIMKRAGITGRGSNLIGLRSTFAVYWIRRGGSISTLGRILGHRSFNTALGFDPDQE